MKNYSLIEDKENVARYVYAPLYINKKTGLPKWQVYKPNKYGETSVTRQDYATKEEVFSLGQDLGQDLAKRVSYRTVLQGTADIGAKHITSTELSMKPAPTDRDNNHANIIDWPEEKEERMALCKEILLKSTFVKSA